MKIQKVSNIMSPKRPEASGMKFVVLALVSYLIVFGLSAASWAGSVFRIDQQVASGFFSSTDPSGCIITQVSIFASDVILQFPPGPGHSSSNGFVSIFQFNNCTNVQVIWAEGLTPLGDQDFQVTSKVDSATLNATVNVLDFVSGTSFDVYVDMTWTSTGPLGRLNSHSHQSFSGCKTNVHSNSVFRPVQASGIVSDGVTNFTPAVFESASLSSDQSGNVDIGCQ
jgi:hypothetical protein